MAGACDRWMAAYLRGGAWKARFLPQAGLLAGCWSADVVCGAHQHHTLAMCLLRGSVRNAGATCAVRAEQQLRLLQA